MTEPVPVYNAERQAVDSGEPLPARAVNLARRVLQLERQCAGRGRVEFQVVFIDGAWVLLISKPGPAEYLGE